MSGKKDFAADLRDSTESGQWTNFGPSSLCLHLEEPTHQYRTINNFNKNVWKFQCGKIVVTSKYFNKNCLQASFCFFAPLPRPQWDLVCDKDIYPTIANAIANLGMVIGGVGFAYISDTWVILILSLYAFYLGHGVDGSLSNNQSLFGNECVHYWNVFRYGRKKGLFFSVLLLSVSGIAASFAPEIYSWMILRMFFVSSMTLFFIVYVYSAYHILGLFL